MSTLVLAVPASTEMLQPEQKSLIHQTEGEPDGASSQPLCSQTPDRPVRAAGCFGLGVGQGPYFPLPIPFSKFMFLVIPMKHNSRKSWFGVIKIIKNVGFFFSSSFDIKHNHPRKDILN